MGVVAAVAVGIMVLPRLVEMVLGRAALSVTEIGIETEIESATENGIEDAETEIRSVTLASAVDRLTATVIGIETATTS